MSNHTFNIDIATEYGIGSAVLFQHFSFWCQQNEKNGVNIEDGKAWTYDTRANLYKKYPYLKSPSNVGKILGKMKKQGLIYSMRKKSASGLSLNWYSISDYGHSLLANNANTQNTQQDILPTQQEKITQQDASRGFFMSPQDNITFPDVNDEITFPDVGSDEKIVFPDPEVTFPDVSSNEEITFPDNEIIFPEVSANEGVVFPSDEIIFPDVGSSEEITFPDVGSSDEITFPDFDLNEEIAQQDTGKGFFVLTKDINKSMAQDVDGTQDKNIFPVTADEIACSVANDKVVLCNNSDEAQGTKFPDVSESDVTSNDNLNANENNVIPSAGNVKLLYGTNNKPKREVKNVPSTGNVKLSYGTDNNAPNEVKRNPIHQMLHDVFNLYKENQLPCWNGNEATFLSQETRQAMSAIQKFKTADILQAVKNYISVLNMGRKGDSWWSCEMAFGAFCEKTINRFLPCNFNPASYKVQKFKTFKEKPLFNNSPISQKIALKVH